MRVVVDFEKCIASGDCVAASPEVFAQNDDGIVVLLNDAPREDLLSSVEQAIDGCPVGCIDLED